MTTPEQVQRFAERMESERIAAYLSEYPGLTDTINAGGLIFPDGRDGQNGARRYRARVSFGAKYARVDFNGSGVYMVEMVTGAIFGIKAYGVIHRGHQYGTLDTIDQWDWSGYSARRTAAA